MIVVNSSTRQFTIPGADLVFGVEADSGSEIKEFQAPRYVGNNLDLAGSFIRLNYRNANGEVDSYLVQDVTVDGDNILFNWELTPKVTMYKGHVSFVMCVTGPDAKVKWHTTLGKGQVLEGLEPDADMVESGTADVVAQLIAMVEAQTAAVETVGETWVKNVKSEGATQVDAVRSAAETAEEAAVAEIEAKGVNTLAAIPEDYTALQNAVDALNRSRGPMIVCEAAGESVVIGDSSNLPIQGLRVFGKTAQVTTTGAQLIPFPYFNGNKTYNGITWTTNADGSVNAKGTATATSPLYFTNSAHELAPGQYTISGSTNGVTVRMDSTVRETGKWKAGVAISKNGQPVTFTITEEDTAACFYTIYASVESGNTVDVTIHPMLNAGPSALPWEIYTGGKPSPSPEYPQELVSLEPVVTVVGKNLLTAPYKDGVSKEHGGLTYTVREDGGVHVVGTVTSAESYFVLSEFNFGESSVAMGKSNGVYVWSDCLYNRGRHYTLLYFSNGDEVDRIYYPQVELGTTATEYEVPATTQTVEITHTLPGVPVTSSGNYTDSDGQQWICDEVDLERGVYVQRVRKIVCDGTTETWYTQADIAYITPFTEHPRHTDFNGKISSHYQYAPNVDGGYWFGKALSVKDTIHGAYTDRKDEWIAWVKEQYASGIPITFMYVLASPIETPLSETEIAAYRDLHSNYPNTTILNDSGAHMVVKYAADTKLYIDNKIKEALQ